MIRVLHVVSSLNINAGVMSVIMNYYRHINRNLIQFDFLYFYKMDKTYIDEIHNLGGNTFLINKPISSPFTQIELNKFFKQNKYNVVHCHPIWGSELVAFPAKSNGVNYIIQHSHSTQYSDKPISAIRNRLANLFVGLSANRFMACSPEAASLFPFYISDKDIYLLNNAIDISAYSYNATLRKEFRNKYGIDDNTLLIGNVGRLCKQKNQAFLIEVFTAILQKNHNVKLMIVGDGELNGELRNIVKNKNLENNVIFTGRLSDIKSVLSSFDLFVLPSLFEGAPVSVIEALSSGLRCIISDTITSTLKIDNVTFMSLSDEVKKWSELVLEYLNKSQDCDRNDVNFLKEYGFDISIEAIKLQNYYLAL